MVGLDVEIVVYTLPLKPDVKPVKQKLRRWRPMWLLKIKEEIMKQHNVSFLKVVLYLEWLANVVPVPKTDGSACASTTVVTLKFGSSMHDARAQVHRSELGSLLAVGPEEGNSTRKCWKRGKNKDKTKSELPPCLLNRETRKTRESMRKHAGRCKCYANMTRA